MAEGAAQKCFLLVSIRRRHHLQVMTTAPRARSLLILAGLLIGGLLAAGPARPALAASTTGLDDPATRAVVQALSNDIAQAIRAVRTQRGRLRPARASFQAWTDWLRLLGSMEDRLRTVKSAFDLTLSGTANMTADRIGNACAQLNQTTRIWNTAGIAARDRIGGPAAVDRTFTSSLCRALNGAACTTRFGHPMARCR